MFGLAKQMKNDQKDVGGVRFIKCGGKFLTCDADVLLQWQSYISNLLNETNPLETEDIKYPGSGALRKIRNAQDQQG